TTASPTLSLHDALPICINAKGMATDLTRNKLDGLTDRTKQLGAKGLAWFKVGDGGALESPLTKFLSDDEQGELVRTMGAEAGDRSEEHTSELQSLRHLV